LSVPWILEDSKALDNLVFSPVAYLKEYEVFAELHAVVEKVRTNTAFLRSVDRKLILNFVFNMLMTGVVCLKHEGFREEREWRLIYAPKRLSSPFMEPSTEIMGGIPQTIYEIPIDNTVEGIPGDLDLSKLFDRLIIAPSPYSWAMYESFVGALTEAGIAEAEKRVSISTIPIRT
jgi:hypothetical protein